MRRVYGAPNAGVAISDQMLGCLIPWESFGHLSCDPLRCWIGGHCAPDQFSSSVAKNHQTIEQLEGDGADNEEVGRSDPGRLVAQECLPALRTRSSGTDHISSNGRFSDVDSEHEQLAMDFWRSPERVLAAHPADQFTDFAVDPGVFPTPPRLPTPVGAKATSMPAKHALRLDDNNGIQH
jgi:hypothetical protein